jgi:hypothetical protein
VSICPSLNNSVSLVIVKRATNHVLGINSLHGHAYYGTSMFGHVYFALTLPMGDQERKFMVV